MKFLLNKPLILILLLSFFLPAFSQIRHSPHPLYIANLLIDDVTIEQMSQTCHFHHLTEASSEDGYTVFTDSKGNKLRFKKTDNPESGINGRIIELQTSDNTKTIEKILKEIGYKKQNKTYEKGSHLTPSHISCYFSTKNKIKTFTFLKVKNK